MMMQLTMPDTATFDEWTDMGRRLCTGARQVQWLIGDWLIAGVERYGEKARDQANAIFRTDVERLHPIVETCRRFPEPVRHPALSFTHHRAVMAVQDDAEAHQLLTRAETDGLTTAALKAQVKVATSRQITTPDWSDDTVEDREYRAIAQAWNRASTVAARRMFAEMLEEVGMGEIEL